MGAKIGVLLNCGQQSQFSKVRREFDAGRVNLDPPMTCADWPVPGNLTLLHPQTAYTRKPLHRVIVLPVARAKSISIALIYRQCSPLRPRWEKHTNSRFFRFFVRSVPLFRSLMLTPM